MTNLEGATSAQDVTTSQVGGAVIGAAQNHGRDKSLHAPGWNSEIDAPTGTITERRTLIGPGGVEVDMSDAHAVNAAMMIVPSEPPAWGSGPEQPLPQ